MKLDENVEDVQIRHYNKINNELRADADKATTWAELPSAYRDMVLADLGDFSASCRTREWVHVKLFEGSRAKELARKVLVATVPARICPEHTVPVFKRDAEGIWQDTGKEERCPGSGKPMEDDWYCSDGACHKDMR
jgi:hypothetical protein